MTNSNVSDRELSCFFVRELLPLYLEGRLDAIRTEQVTLHLKTCDDCRDHFIKTKKARQILQDLSHTQVQASLVAYLKKEHHFWIEIFERAGWRRWPATLKWAVELSAVALALVVVIHWFPWLNFAKQIHSMRAAQVAAINKSAAPVTPPAVASDDVAAQGDEEPAPFNTAELKPPGPKSHPIVDEESDEPQTAAAPPVAVAGSVSPTPAPSSDASNDDSTTAAEEAVTGAADATDNKKVGYVWRGSLKVEELSDDLEEKVTRVITELGGVKAGQVELGWHREGQRYYHFILPEENYEKLLSALNGEGRLTLNREVHPRVIKEGHMRIIMTLEEDQ